MGLAVLLVHVGGCQQEVEGYQAKLEAVRAGVDPAVVDAQVQEVQRRFSSRKSEHVRVAVERQIQQLVDLETLKALLDEEHSALAEVNFERRLAAFLERFPSEAARQAYFERRGRSRRLVEQDFLTDAMLDAWLAQKGERPDGERVGWRFEVAQSGAAARSIMRRLAQRLQSGPEAVGADWLAQHGISRRRASAREVSGAGVAGEVVEEGERTVFVHAGEARPDAEFSRAQRLEALKQLRQLP